MSEEKILFMHDRFYILLTFFDFNIHVKNEQISKKIKKAKEHRYSKRFFKYLEL